MRTVLLAALLVTSVIALPGASAKAFAEDATGDTETQAFGGPAVPIPNPSADSADLVSLDLVETAEDMTFTLKVAGFGSAVSASDYAIYFTWAKDEYVIRAFRQVAQGVAPESTRAYIMNLESEDRFDTIADLEHEVDAAAGLFTLHLPKAYLLDDRGRFPALGDELKDVYVEAYSSTNFFNFGAAGSYDRMPDGENGLKYAFLYGDLVKGHLRLDADDRVRVSNGGATTFVYRVVVSNTGEVDDEVSLSLNEMPEGWNGTIQSPIRVPAGAERSVALLVSVPFAHEHGGFSSFNVSAKSDRDPNSLAAVRMGVLHTPIPQPAGHHADLYLHAENFNGGIFGNVFPWRGGTMNTDSAHETDAPEATISGSDGDSYIWRIPLDPVLRMGLDFDLDRAGSLAGSVIGRTNAPGQFRAELELVQTIDDESEGIIIAESDSMDAVLGLQDSTPFTLTITPNEEAEYIPYAKGQNLVLWLYFESEQVNICCFGGQSAPGLQTESFKLTLPLNEYHDKLTGITDSLDSLSIKAEGAVEKVGLPGSTMTYAFTLTNHGESAEVIDLDLAGTDALLGTLVPEDVIELGSKETRKLTLAVYIPIEKNDGEELEVLIFAHAQEDPSKSAIARTKTVVGKTGASELVADETAVLAAAKEAEQNDAPGPGALLALAGVAAAALLVRRRK